MAGPLIVTAEFASADFAWLDGLRRAHFPPERNQVRAHLTLFHALPPFAEAEVRSRLAQLARSAAPTASIEGMMDLGGGVAFRIVSPDLYRIRSELGTGLHGLLTAQDSQGWRPHVTVQNKVSPKIARALLEQLQTHFSPRPLGIAGLALHRYLGGPWKTLQRYRFRG